jgi:hypothetical protein
MTFHNTGNFPRRITVRDLHVAFNIPYFYGFMTKLYRQQTKIMQSHYNKKFRNLGHGKAQHTKYKRLKLGDGQAFDLLRD